MIRLPIEGSSPTHRPLNYIAAFSAFTFLHTFLYLYFICICIFNCVHIYVFRTSYCQFSASGRCFLTILRSNDQLTHCPFIVWRLVWTRCDWLNAVSTIITLWGINKDVFATQILQQADWKPIMVDLRLLGLKFGISLIRKKMMMSAKVVNDDDDDYYYFKKRRRWRWMLKRVGGGVGGVLRCQWGAI